MVVTVLTWLGLILLGYVIGAFPTAYVVGRILRGVDIRRMGSGNVGGANIWATVNRKAGVIVALLDIAKGAVAVLIAKGLEVGLGLQGLAGLAAVAGHNWSPFLRFSGGRGVSPTLGILMALTPLGLLAFCGLSLVLLITSRSVPLAVGLGVFSLPLSTWALGEPWPVWLAMVGIVGAIAFKRLFPQLRAAFPGGQPRIHTLFYRLFLDRDIRDRTQWVHRASEEAMESRETGSRAA